MADLNITVDSKQVVEAKRDISDLERSFSSAYKSAQTFMAAFSRTERMDAYANSLNKVARANQELINNNLGVTKSYKSAEESAKAFTKVLENQERAAREATAALNQRLGVTGPSATESGAGFAALEGQIERLKAKYDSVYAASQLYERSLNELNQAQMLGAINAKQHESALEQLNNEYQQFQNGSANAMNRFQNHVQGSSRGMNQLGLVVQQTGYQVGDFLVQVQGGTNWMVAFGQQATQLAGLMTTFGGKLVYIGTALGILIPLATAVGAAFMRTRQEADSASSAVLSLADAQDRLNRTSAEYGTKLEMLRFGVDTEAEAVALREILDITTRIQRLNREYAETDSLARRQAIAEESRELKDQLSTQREIVDTVNEKRQAYETAMAINKQMQAVELAHARAMGDQERERVAAGEAYYQKMLAVQGAHAAAAKTAAEIDKALGKGAASALKLAGIDISKPLSAGAAQAAQIAASLGVAYNQAVGIMNTFNSLTSLPDERGSQRSTVRGANTRMPEQPWLDTKTGGAAGGGGGNSEIDKLEALRQQITLEKELLGVSEAMGRVIQAVGEDRAKYSQAELNAVAAEIQAYEEKKAALEEQQRLGQLMKSSMEDAFMSIIDGTMSAKDAFKKFAYDVIRELYRVLVVQRMVGQFQSGGGGILGAVFGALGGGATGGFGGGRESGGSVMAGQSYLVGERGPELIVPRHSGTVMNANLTKKATSGGGDVIVTNNINVPAGADSATIRAEVTKMIPQITQITKAAVIDAKQRGGQMASAFR
jgi:hypothetical protein